jgi:hypothetical protein
MQQILMLRAAWGSLLGLCGLFACNWDDVASETLTPESASNQQANLYCRGVASCCKAAGFTMDLQGCEIYVSAKYRSAIPNDKLIVFNPAMAAQCLLKQAPYADTCGPTPITADCKAAYNGTLPPGATCTSDDECDMPYGGDATCFGGPGPDHYCLVWVHGKQGETCAGHCTLDSFGYGDCGYIGSPTLFRICYNTDHLYCSSATSTCEKLRIAGESCQSSSDCEESLYCDTLTQTCRPKRTAGEDCDVQNAPCIETAYCDSSSLLCAARKEDGANCQSPGECLHVCVTNDTTPGICLPSEMTQENCTNPSF